MDEYDLPDLGAYGQQQQAAMQPPPAPEPWTAADDQRLQQLNQGLASIQSDVDNGTLFPHEGAKLREQALEMRRPFLARQQAAKQAALAEQQQMTLHARAQEQAMVQADAAHAAQNFPAQVVHVPHPHTGELASFYQTKPGEWDQAEFPDKPEPGEAAPPAAEPDGEMHGYAPPQLEQQSDGTHRLTIHNGARRSETVYAPDESSPTGYRARGTTHYDAQGNVYTPGAVPANEPFRQRAARELGIPEPPKFVMGPHGRPVESGIWKHWDTRVGQIEGRLRQQDAAAKARAAQQVETDYRDALKNHPLKDYAESADPHAARTDALMADFAALHPNDPRVARWTAGAASRTAAVAKKDPEAMSLHELAAATLGPHTNVKDMLEKAQKEVLKDERPVPEDTERGGVRYNPKGGGFSEPGPYKAMNPEGIHDEAQRRVRAQLTSMLTDKRKAAGQARGEGAQLGGQNSLPNSVPPPQQAAPPKPAAPAPKVGEADSQTILDKIRKRQAARRPAPAAPTPAGLAESDRLIGLLGGP